MTVIPPERIYPESIEGAGPGITMALKSVDDEVQWSDDTGGGGGGEILTFNFASPDTVWTAVHNFGTMGVEVKAFNPDGDLITVEVDYLDENTVQVTWYYPSTGYLLVFT